jgi:hypothetical protein
MQKNAKAVAAEKKSILKTLNVRNIGILVKDRSDSTSQHTFVT